jgi:peptidoglycan/LPS O-acetylase OafA/YrhL
LYLLHTLVSQVPTSVLQYLMTPDTVICKGLVMALTLIPVWIFYRFMELPFISTSRAARREKSGLAVRGF